MPKSFDTGFGQAFGSALNVGTLVLQIGDHSGYEDGDVVVAINRQRCRGVHAEAICHPRRATRNSNGLLALDNVSRDWFERTSQYRFERVSATEVLRVDLATLGTELFGATPNERSEQIDVARFVARRKLMPGFGLFGTPGAEIWYGGHRSVSNDRLDHVWGAIETKTPLREVDHLLWPAGSEELKTKLWLHVDDFEESEAETLVAPERDFSDPDNPVVVRKRSRQIPWRALPGMSNARIQQIEDMTRSVDIRTERKHPRAVHLRVKT